VVVVHVHHRSQRTVHNPVRRRELADQGVPPKINQQQLQGRELTDKEVAEAGIGLIIAGNDTSGLGLTALLAVLPQFPQVLARLREEQQQVRGG
jgi:cytochrome P450